MIDKFIPTGSILTLLMNERHSSYENHDEMLRDISQLYPERIIKPLMERRNQTLVKSRLISELLGSYGDDAAAEDELPIVENS